MPLIYVVSEIQHFSCWQCMQSMYWTYHKAGTKSARVRVDLPLSSTIVLTSLHLLYAVLLRKQHRVGSEHDLTFHLETERHVTIAQ